MNNLRAPQAATLQPSAPSHPPPDGHSCLLPLASCLKKVAAVGMFDGVHSGHRHLLDELQRQAGERSMRPLAITFANHPLEVVRPEAAPKLLTSPQQKVELIRAAGVEQVVCLPFDAELRDTSAAAFLDMLRCRYGVRALLMGFNNRFGHGAPRGFDEYCALGAAHGVEIIAAGEFHIDSGESPSSTAIRRALQLGDIALANAMLGREYSLEGSVTHGKELGRRLGFPTANVAVEGYRQLPAPGVYAARALGRPAMVNIGRRPTVDAADAPLSVEAHIIGLPEGTDLYGSMLSLEFTARLRDERRFPSPEALATQLAADRASVVRRQEARGVQRQEARGERQE